MALLQIVSKKKRKKRNKLQHKQHSANKLMFPSVTTILFIFCLLTFRYIKRLYGKSRQKYREKKDILTIENSI